MPIYWDLLCEHIYNKKCVLFIGNEFPIEVNKENEMINSTFSKLLSNYLIEEFGLKCDNQFYLKERNDFDLCQIGSLCVKNNNLGSEVVNSKVADFLNNSGNNITSFSFRELLKLPFTLILDTNYNDFFHSECNKEHPNRIQKNSINDFYDYQNKDVEKRVFEWVNFLSEISVMSPIIYNLFGSIEQLQSLAITEYDLIHLLTSIISKDPPLPKGLSTMLKNETYCFLFIGFGLQYRDWYYRILHKALDCKKKWPVSYVIESVYNLHERKETEIYFQLNHNTIVFEHDSKNFIYELINRYEQYESKQNLKHRTKMPKAFVSYINEDKDKIERIKLGLEAHGIEVYVDSSSIGVEIWRPAITRFINTSDAFILAQSKRLKQMVNKNNTYVCDEIEIALEAQDRKLINSNSKFIMPCYIDSKKSVVRGYEQLANINSIDMIEDEKFDSKIKNLANEIRAQYGRNIQ